MKISPMIRFCSPDVKGPNKKDKVYYIIFDTEEEGQVIITLLEYLKTNFREVGVLIEEKAFKRREAAMNEECKYYGGNVWEAPSKKRCMIVAVPPGQMILISDPSEQGSCGNIEEDGTWQYTLEGLKVRLLGWKWIGTHKDYIEELCKEISENSPHNA